MKTKKRIAIVGGGPSALFLFKRLIHSGISDFEVDIFERKKVLGAGMPYSQEGANREHITNVSGNETPELVSSVVEWLKEQPNELLKSFDIDITTINDYKVLPRLLFGYYLTTQFDLLLQIASDIKIKTTVRYESEVLDIKYDAENKEVWLYTSQSKLKFDDVIICTGHSWPSKWEGKHDGCFDSPYPPSKLELNLNHAVALRGSSLTAIDAIRTLARKNGKFSTDEDGNINYTLNKKSVNFSIVMHSREGLLPALRFHLEDSYLSNDSLLTPEEIQDHKDNNDGFLSLDYIFQKDFKDIFKDKDLDFYQKIKDLKIEEFVDAMMELRVRFDSFQLLKAEYIEAEKSIKKQESIYWKEMLAVLSFAMNHPAKYFSAEDMERLQKILMPLISIIIAFVPQKSCIDLLALYQAGVLSIVSVGHESEIEPQEEGIIYKYYDEKNTLHSQSYRTFIDCVGQPHLSFKDFPFTSLKADKNVSAAKLRFQNNKIGEIALSKGDSSVEVDSQGNYYRTVSGISINDKFQILDHYGANNENIYIMAVPYIGGFNPDYSGLDFCEATSLHIVKSILGI